MNMQLLNQKVKSRLDLIAQTIFDKKGCNIVAIDVREISTMADVYLIAEGQVERHVKSIGKAIVENIGIHPYLAEGREGDWIVLDYGEIIIHLMIPDVREKYALEELWRDGKIVDLDIRLKN